MSEAEQIAAVKTIYSLLPDIASLDNIEYLLRFENPLEVVKDGWLVYNNADLTNELKHVLWFVSKNTSIWEDYKVVEEMDSHDEQNVTMG